MQVIPPLKSINSQKRCMSLEKLFLQLAVIGERGVIASKNGCSKSMFHLLYEQPCCMTTD